jgi:hypothetical protein
VLSPGAGEDTSHQESARLEDSMKNEDDNLPHERVTKLLVDLKEQLRRAALERMARLNWTLPRGFKFDRDEANER